MMLVFVLTHYDGQDYRILICIHKRPMSQISALFQIYFNMLGKLLFTVITTLSKPSPDHKKICGNIRIKIENPEHLKKKKTQQQYVMFMVCLLILSI